MPRIGISRRRFFVEIPRLQDSVNQDLIWIDPMHPGQAWTLVSSLAGGGDRMVVRRALIMRPEATLWCPCR